MEKITAEPSSLFPGFYDRGYGVFNGVLKGNEEMMTMSDILCDSACISDAHETRLVIELRRECTGRYRGAKRLPYVSVQLSKLPGKAGTAINF